MLDADNLVRVTSVRTEYQAGIIVDVLEGRGIKSVMTGMSTASFRSEAPGWVEVLVAEQDLAAAHAVLEEAHTDEATIDWSQVDVGQPEDE